MAHKLQFYYRGNVTYRFSQNLGAIEADTAENTEHSFNEPNMIHRFCKLKVTEVTGAVSHVGHTGLTLHLPINCAETRVAQTANLRLASFRRLAVLYMHNRHLSLQTQPKRNNTNITPNSKSRPNRKLKIQSNRMSENYDLIGAEYAELDETDFRDLGRREGEPQIHCDAGNRT